MLPPKTCKCDGPYCHHESDMLIVVTNYDGGFDMRGATDEEKRQHRIKTLTADRKRCLRELSEIQQELARLE